MTSAALLEHIHHNFFEEGSCRRTAFRRDQEEARRFFEVGGRFSQILAHHQHGGLTPRISNLKRES